MAKTVKFEPKIINRILRLIGNNIDYLTKKENLPQLAKLGYMYEELYYAGRCAYGYEGKISKGWECENNPKYKLEMADKGTDEQYDLVYDAWGMHVMASEGAEPTSFKQFKKNVLGSTKVSALEKLLFIENKTIEDWVKIKTHKSYRYPSKNRRGVLDRILCVIGAGYKYENGFVFMTASGADQNIAAYGDWKNAKFSNKIQKVVDEIMSDPLVKEAITVKYNFQTEYRNKIKAEREKEREEFLKSVHETIEKRKKNPNYKKDQVDILLDKLVDKIEGNKGSKQVYEIEEPYHPFYPICEYSPIYSIDENAHSSYLKAAVEICNDILQHEKEEREGNVKFAKKFLEKEFIKQYL